VTARVLHALSAAALLAVALAIFPAQAADEPPLFGQPAAGQPNFTGKWLISGPMRHLLTSSGQEPPLNAAGKAEYAKRQAALKQHDMSVDPISRCLMHDTPRLLYTRYPFLILQTRRDVSFVFEANHTFRNIYWTEKLPEDPDPTYLGVSIARWEGNTLVIDSIGFNDLTWLDYSGLPHGEKLKVQERYTLKGSDAIEGSVAITDPDYYTASWTTNFILKRQPGMALKENVCIDTHRM
jgi:hypothetical protein